MGTNNGLVQVFENARFGELRVVDINGEPWFVAADVCRALEIANVSDAIKRLDSDEKSGIDLTDPHGRVQNTNCVSEPGLYALVLGSRKRDVKPFKRWVTHEVIPSIRKHGGYLTDAAKEELFSDPETFARVVANWADERKARLAAEQKILVVEQKIEEQKPLVQFANHVADTSDLIDMGEFAKLAKDENIVIGRNRLFAWLRDKGYLMEDNVPYQRYVEQGIFVLREGSFDTPYGPRVYKKTYVTGKGQIYLIEKLRKAFGACA